jgi:STIMATE family
VFDTELLSINGVKEDPLPAKPTPSPTDSSTPSNTSSPGKDINMAIEGSPDGPKHDGQHNGECKLLGKFAIFVQAALGGLALLALVWKRWREHPRRPVKVWIFDVSKQVVGSLMVHFANVFLSMISSGNFDIASQSTDVAALTKGSDRDHPNPCSFYLLNLGIDTTIGIPILVFFLRIFHGLFMFTPLANPPESLKSGVYGHPPKGKWWLKQALIYFLGLLAMKIIVFLMFQVFPWLGWVGDWALRWTEGKEWVQITFVMLIFPLIMNAAQYWIIDSFIKDPAGDYDYDSVGQDNDEDEDENEGLMGQRRDSDDENTGRVRIQPQGGTIVADGEAWNKESARTKEPNPLPLPVEFESEDEDDVKPGSSAERE